MKKQNEVKNTNVAVAAQPKAKRTKKERTFFLYVKDEGFICRGDKGMPMIGWQKPTSFSVRSRAVYAAEFFKQIGIADDITVFMNIG